MFNYWWLEYFIRISSGGSHAVDNAQCLFWSISVYLHRHETMQEHFFQMQAKHLIKWSFKCWLIIELWGNKRHALGNFRFWSNHFFWSQVWITTFSLHFRKFCIFDLSLVEKLKYQFSRPRNVMFLKILMLYINIILHGFQIATLKHIDCVFIFWRLFSEFYCCKWQKK